MDVRRSTAEAARLRDASLKEALAQEKPDLVCINQLLADAVEHMDGWSGGLDGLDGSWTPLHAAASNPRIPKGVVDALVTFGCAPDAEGARGTPLMVAAFEGSLTAVEELLNRGVSANGEDDDLRPLTCAIQGGTVAAVAALLKFGATVDKHEHVELALERAFGQGSAAARRPTPRKGTPAWTLAQPSLVPEIDLEMIRLLIAGAIEGGEVPAPLGDDLGERLAAATPLHWAVAFGSRTLVERRLRTQTQARLKDAEGWTPLHWAACCNESSSVHEWLLARGADRMAKTHDGKTAREIAETAENGTALRWLA